MITIRSFRHALPLLMIAATLAGAAMARAAAPKGDPYLLKTDPVTGEALPAAAKVVIFDDGGRELRFASEANLKTFQAAPDKYRKAVDQKMVEAQLPFYPLDTCIVSGEKLGGMGSVKAISRKSRPSAVFERRGSTTARPAASSFARTSSKRSMRITGAERCIAGGAGSSTPVTSVSARARVSVELSRVQKRSFACGGIRNTG